MIDNFLKKVYTEDSWYMEDVIDGGGEITTYYAKSTTSEEEAMVYTHGDGIISSMGNPYPPFLLYNIW